MSYYKKLRRGAARMALVFVLLLYLSPVALAVGGERYGIFSVQNALDWTARVDGVPVPHHWEPNDSHILITSEEEKMELVCSIPDTYLRSGSRVFQFVCGDDGWGRYEQILRLPDGSYVKVQPLSETITFRDIRFTASEGPVQEEGWTDGIRFGFDFEGEYRAAPIAREFFLKEENGDINGLSLSSTELAIGAEEESYTIRLRATGTPTGFAPLEWNNKVREKAYFRAAMHPTEYMDVTYEINCGSGWEPFDDYIYPGGEGDPWDILRNDPEAAYGYTRFNNNHFSFWIHAQEPGTPTTLETMNTSTPQTVAVTTAAAAATAAVAAAAVSASAGAGASAAAGAVVPGPELTQTVDLPQGTEEVPEAEPPKTDGGGGSILVNGGAPLPALCNTAKATVEISVLVEGGEAQDWKWAAVCVAPDAPRCAVGSVMGLPGGIATVSVMLTGQKLPKTEIPIFLELTAFTTEEEPVTLTALAEFTLREKGLRAACTVPTAPEAPESYQVTYVGDSNLDGIAEVTALASADYTVLAQTGEDGSTQVTITAKNPQYGSVTLTIGS